MPTYTVKEIADLIEKPAKTVEVYCARKKLIKNSDKKIDTSNPINESFLTKYIVEKNTVQSKIPPELLPESKPDTEKKNGKAKDKLENTKGLVSFELDLAIKRLNAEKIQKDIELKDIEIKKKNNELVDLNQTLSITKAYSDSLKKNFSQSVQILIQEICSRYEIPSDKAGAYSMKVIELVNESSKASVAILKELNDEEHS